VKSKIEGLIIGIIASLIAGLILAPFLIPFLWSAYKTEICIGAFFVIILCIYYLILERVTIIRKNLREAFEIAKPVKDLTPDDFHITNYIEFYITRESDKKIEEFLSQGKYIFITGIPMLGKTRMAYVATKTLKDHYILKPKYEKIDTEKLKLPFFKKKFVLFFDDLDKYEGKFSIDALIRKIKEKAKNFVVIATCRSGEEFDQISTKKEMEDILTQCLKNKIEPRLLEINEEENLATEAGKDLKQIASDGTPGSITIDLRYMKERYEKLKEEKSILKCLKLLRSGNIFLWKEGLVKEVSREIFDMDINRTKWDDYIKSLLSNGFIRKSGEQINISHDVYLDNRFLDEYEVTDSDLIQLKKTLFTQEDAENLFYLGNAFYYMKNKSEALGCYQKSIQINPDYAETHYNLGILLSDLKRPQEAEEEYRSALRINPDYAEVHNNLGILLSDLKRPQEAEEEYRSALRINPDYAEAHYNLGNLLSDLKRPQEAEEEYRSALRINPDYAEAHGNLGILLVDLNRKKEARRELETARDLFRKQGREEDAKRAEEILKEV
jgi:tetratricopeptide (TPR) repeat protein